MTKDVTLTVVVTLDYDASTDDAVDFLEEAIRYKLDVAEAVNSGTPVRTAAVLVPEVDLG